MAEDLQLADLNDAVKPKTAAPPQAAERAHKIDARPRLCHRQAQERRGPRLDQARQGQDHRQRQAREGLFRPPGAAHDVQPAA